MNQHLDLTPLGHLLARQPHRLSPEQLEQAVEDYRALSSFVSSFMKGNIEPTIFANQIRLVSEKAMSVEERWNRNRTIRIEQGENVESYKHDSSFLDKLQPKIEKVNEEIVRSIFPEADPQESFNELQDHLHPTIRRTFLPMENQKDFNQSDNVLIARLPNRAHQNITSDILHACRFVAGRSRDIDFFFNNHYFNYVLPDNPYSFEQSSEERRLHNYEHEREYAEKKVNELIETLTELRPSGILTMVARHLIKKRRDRDRANAFEAGIKIKMLGDNLTLDHPDQYQAFNKEGLSEKLIQAAYKTPVEKDVKKMLLRVDDFFNRQPEKE